MFALQYQWCQMSQVVVKVIVCFVLMLACVEKEDRRVEVSRPDTGHNHGNESLHTTVIHLRLL